MPKNEDGEFELVVGNKQLLSIVFILMVLFGVVFSMGYFLGRANTGGEAAAASGRRVSRAGQPPGSNGCAGGSLAAGAGDAWSRRWPLRTPERVRPSRFPRRLSPPSPRLRKRRLSGRRPNRNALQPGRATGEAGRAAASAAVRIGRACCRTDLPAGRGGQESAGAVDGGGAQGEGLPRIDGARWKARTSTARWLDRSRTPATSRAPRRRSRVRD